MSEKYNINSYNHVKVEKLDGNSMPIKQESVNSENNTKFVKVEEYTDSEFDTDESRSESENGSQSGTDSDTSTNNLDDDESVSSTNSTTSSIPRSYVPQQGGDNESVSSMSTTDLLSKDPLFLVLSEFLMDDETGDNIVNVGNNIVKVLSKINSKLGRIADVLEKKHKKNNKSRTE